MSGTTELRTILNNYRCALENLQTEDVIAQLTAFAHKYVVHAASLVHVIEDHLIQVSYDQQLLVIYLIDSIVKNIAIPYARLFSRRIVHIYKFVLNNTRHWEDMLELKRVRTTWQCFFSEPVLENLDRLIAKIELKFPATDRQSMVLLLARW